MRRPPLPFLVPALVAGTLAAAAPPAVAAVPFKRCSSQSSALCARVPVPLDRSGTTPGTVSLLVQRVPAHPRRAGVLMVLAGGPGQAATPLRESIGEVVDPALRGRELVVFDQRGTGSSGVLRCPSVERVDIPDEAAAVGACGAKLGASSSHYTTRDSVEDIEAVRQALGVERLSLLGVSYGTKVALGYATAHPDHIDRLVLDSPVGLEGPDPFGRSGMAALPRVLADLCRGVRCRGVTRDPLGDLGRLAGRLRIARLRGTVIGPRGQHRHGTLSEADLLGLVLTSDTDPTLLPALPAAVHSVLRGDSAPLLRLARSAEAVQAPEPPREFSTALLVTTLCEESAFPWTRTAGLGQRRAELDAAANALGDGPFAPFGRAAAVNVSILPACLGWPAAPTRPSLAGPAPATPTLLFDGTSDLRTPLEDGRAIAASLPDARVVAATGIGHSVLSTATTRCPGSALGAFFAGRPVRHACPRDRLLDIPPDSVAPLALREVIRPPGMGGKRGRTLTAALLTFGDTGASLLASLPSAVADVIERGSASVGGLRGGYVTLGLEGLRLHHVVYVPGVVVSGTVMFVGRGSGISATFRVSGPAAAHGTVRLLPDDSTRGRLGGRAFHLRPNGLAATAAAAGTPSPVASARRLRALLNAQTRRPPLSGRPPRWLVQRAVG